MTALERWSLHLGALLTALSGLATGWLRTFGRVAGEFGPEPHPLQGLAQHLHVLAAPLLLFALGMAVRGHLAAKLRAGAERRGTGLGLGLLILPMVASGYLLQVAVAPGWRLAWAWVHGPASLLFLVAYLGHGLQALKAWVQRAPGPDPSGGGFDGDALFRLQQDLAHQQGRLFRAEQLAPGGHGVAEQDAPPDGPAHGADLPVCRGAAQ